MLSGIYKAALIVAIILLFTDVRGAEGRKNNHKKSFLRNSHKKESSRNLSTINRKKISTQVKGDSNLCKFDDSNKVVDCKFELDDAYAGEDNYQETG
jgi:hypothetical protein